MSNEMIALAVTILIQVGGGLFFYGRLTQKIDGMAEHDKEQKLAVQTSIDNIFESISDIIKTYLTKEDAKEFYEKKGKD